MRVANVRWEVQGCEVAGGGSFNRRLRVHHACGDKQVRTQTCDLKCQTQLVVNMFVVAFECIAVEIVKRLPIAMTVVVVIVATSGIAMVVAVETLNYDHGWWYHCYQYPYQWRYCW